MENLVDILTSLNNYVFLWKALGKYIDFVKEWKSPNWESLWSQWGVVTSPRWSRRGLIVVNHMCQTKSPSPVRQCVCMMSKYYRVCICSMVFELAASWEKHFVVTSETCLFDNPTHDECWQSRAGIPVFVLPNQVSPFSQPPISTTLPQIIMDTPLPQYYTPPTPPHRTEQIWRDS